MGPWKEEVKPRTQLGGVTKAPQPGREGKESESHELKNLWILLTQAACNLPI